MRARLISSRETARLMGLDDEYILPENYNEAYHLTGDGVAVPVVRHLAKHIFEPLLAPALSAQVVCSQAEFEKNHVKKRLPKHPRMRITNPMRGLPEKSLFQDVETIR